MKTQRVHPLNALPLLLLVWAMSGNYAAAQVRYDVVPSESEVVYAMDHPAHSWTGKSQSATGFVRFDAAMHPVEISISIPVLSFDSGNGNRDSHMAETVESYIYPNVTFHGSDIVQAAAESTGKQHWVVTGDLTFHGVTHPVTADVALLLAEGQLAGDGAFEIKPTDYDIRLPSLLLVKVKDWIRLDFHVVAAAKKS